MTRPRRPYVWERWPGDRGRGKSRVPQLLREFHVKHAGEQGRPAGGIDYVVLDDPAAPHRASGIRVSRGRVARWYGRVKRLLEASG